MKENDLKNSNNWNKQQILQQKRMFPVYHLSFISLIYQNLNVFSLLTQRNALQRFNSEKDMDVKNKWKEITLLLLVFKEALPECRAQQRIECE